MQRTIIKNKNFVFLWIGHFISHSGDSIYAIALPWMILEMTGSKTLTGLVSMSAYLPALIFGLYAGVIVDYYNRKRVMIVSDILRALLVAVIPLSIIYGFVTPLLIGFITFLLASFATFFYPARDSLIPSITTAAELPIANSAIAISGQMSHLMGPLFVAIGMAIFGLTHLFTANSISFIFSIIMISMIVTPIQKITSYKESSQIQSLLNGIKYVKLNKGISTLLILTVANNIFIMGPAIIGLQVFVKEILNENLVVLALLEGAMASGMIIGSVIFLAAIKRFCPANILLFGLVLDGCTFSIMYFVQSNYEAILVLFIHGIGIPLITIARTTLIQMTVPENLRGRLFSMIYMSVMGTTAISIGLTGVILEYFEADILFFIIGVCAALCALIGLISENFISLGQRVN